MDVHYLYISGKVTRMYITEYILFRYKLKTHLLQVIVFLQNGLRNGICSVVVEAKLHSCGGVAEKVALLLNNATYGHCNIN